MEKLGRWRVSAGGGARPVEELDGGGPWLSPRHLLLDRRVVGPPNHRGSGLQLRRARAPPDPPGERHEREERRGGVSGREGRGRRWERERRSALVQRERERDRWLRV